MRFFKKLFFSSLLSFLCFLCASFHNRRTSRTLCISTNRTTMCLLCLSDVATLPAANPKRSGLSAAMREAVKPSRLLSVKMMITDRRNKDSGRTQIVFQFLLRRKAVRFDDLMFFTTFKEFYYSKQYVEYEKDHYCLWL